MHFLSDLNVLVLGLGDSGLAMARWCVRCGAHVTVWDSREAPPHAATLAAELPHVPLLGGALSPDRLAGVQLVLKSPGLAPSDARVAPLLDEARAIGIAIQGELDLFVRALADLKTAWHYSPQLLAITGTNGKTTVTAMTALLVARAGRRVTVAGNIGPTLLDTLSAQLTELPTVPVVVDQAVVEATAGPVPKAVVEPAADAEVEAEPASEAGAEAEALQAIEPVAPDAELPSTQLPGDDEPFTAAALAALIPPPPAEPEITPAAPLPEVWVLELSSFQLDTVRVFEPAAAVVLNITQDHLDWHGTLALYTAAKARVFGSSGVMVINQDDAAVEALVPQPVPAKGKVKAKPVTRPILRFGLQAPRRPGDFGLVTENGMAWLVRALPADETFKRKKGDDAEEIHLQRLMPADALRVRGRHNAANALAALALATAIGCTLAPMLHGLREYTGEPHRVQFVATVGGVEAFDDSKGTNVGATVAALTGLGEDKLPSQLVVILGGAGKGQDFTPLSAPLSRYARAVATLGQDAAAIEAVLGPVPFQRHDTLEAAVAWCFEQAEPGDAVLLSPACASLDMFRNYGHRAEVFVQAVQALALEKGEIA